MKLRLLVKGFVTIVLVAMISSCEMDVRLNENDPMSSDYQESRITVKESGGAITNTTGIYDFGPVVKNTNKEVEFSIENSGDGDLVLTGKPLVAMSGNNEFTVITQPDDTVNPGGGTNFTIRFTAPVSWTSDTPYNATVTIKTDDPENSSFTFNITALLVDVAKPEIQVLAGSTEIADSGNFSMGTCMQGSTLDYTFTIKNIGSADLVLGGVTVSGAVFTLNGANPLTPLAPSATTTFTVRFTPGSVSAGTKTGTVSFATDDADENPFNFTITALCEEFNGLNTVDSAVNGTNTSIDVAGANGQYVAVCYSNDIGNLMLAWSTDGGLTFTEYVVDGTVDHVFKYPSIKIAYISSYYTAYIAYYDTDESNPGDETYGRLKFAKASSSDFTTWSNYLLDSSSTFVGQYASLNLESNTVLNVSYYDKTNGNLKFKRCNGGGSGDWALAVIVDSTGDVGQYTSIDNGLSTDGSTNKIGISYYDVTNGYIKFAYSINSGAAWTTENIAAGAQYSSLAFNGTDINIAYRGPDGIGNNIAYLAKYNYHRYLISKLTYGWHWGWNSPYTIDAAAGSGSHISLAIDADGYLHTSYVTYASFTKHYLYYSVSSTGSTWTSTLLGTGTYFSTSNNNTVGYYNDIATYADRVYISYYAYSRNFLSINSYIRLAKSIDGGASF